MKAESTTLPGRWDLVTHRGCGARFAEESNGKLQAARARFCPMCGKRLQYPLIVRGLEMFDPLALMRGAEKVH